MKTGNIQMLHPATGDLLAWEGTVLKRPTGDVIPTQDGVHLFVAGSNYTDNFGFQWNTFADTQLSDRGFEISVDRFFAETSWSPESLSSDVNVLEVGCGAGRFSNVVLSETSAMLYTLDFSEAVIDNARRHLADHQDRMVPIRSSVEAMPFAPQQFDRVFCLGVLQHTPNPYLSVAELARMVAPGGELVVDFYPRKGWWTPIQAKYLLRPLTKRMSERLLLKVIDANLDWMISLSRFFTKVGVGRLLNRFIPICDLSTTMPTEVSEEEYREWALLDTLDMFSPEFDMPLRGDEVARAAEAAGLDVTFNGMVRYSDGGQSAAVVRARRRGSDANGR